MYGIYRSEKAGAGGRNNVTVTAEEGAHTVKILDGV